MLDHNNTHLLEEPQHQRTLHNTASHPDLTTTTPVVLQLLHHTWYKYEVHNTKSYIIQRTADTPIDTLCWISVQTTNPFAEKPEQKKKKFNIPISDENIFVMGLDDLLWLVAG